MAFGVYIPAGQNREFYSFWENIPSVPQVRSSVIVIVQRIAARLLQNAQVQCPVDTGALRDSLTTKIEREGADRHRIYLESPLHYFRPVAERDRFFDRAVSITSREVPAIAEFVFKRLYSR